MMRQAVKCWENLAPAKRAEFHRNQSLVAKFKQRIRNGVVTVHRSVYRLKFLPESAEAPGEPQCEEPW
jgi:hypothetical protein